MGRGGDEWEVYLAEFQVDKRAKVWTPVWLDILYLNRQFDGGEDRGGDD